jgi:UDP-3-O-[3-hydroxymyristoyl] glucosamine N-acyltransferase
LLSISLAELSAHLRAQGVENRCHGDGELILHAVNALDEAGPGELSFLANPKYREAAAKTRASVVIVGADMEPFVSVPRIVCDDTYTALMLAVVKIHGYRAHPKWGISPRAHLAETATVGKNANIGPGATIADHVVIGDNATIYPGCYVAERARLGHDVVLFPNVVIYDHCSLGDRVTIHAGTIVGEDGLGYAPQGEKWTKIPQAGRVEIGDDVEIGSACTIDRATIGTTRIGSGTKFSNLIAIGHGTKIGEDCMFVAQVGLAGSVGVGRHVSLGGQAGVVGHITIGDNAQIGAKAGVVDSVEPGSAVLGAPAVPIHDCRRQVTLIKRLPDLYKRIRDLESEVQRLQKLLEESRRSAP